MFETVSPEAFIRRDRPIFYETLPVSIALHLIVLASAAGSAFYQIGFPEAPPRLSFSYRIALDPPPPPPPPPRAAQPVRVQPAVEVPIDKIVAPTVIPDEIPVVQPMKVANAEIAPVPVQAEAVEGGVVGGDPNGVIGGTLGGDPKGVLGGLLLDDGRVHFAKNVPLPLFVEHQDYPEYPDSARTRGQEDSVTVRYTIDKRGKVKEIVVLEHAERKIFEDAALSAIRNWRFRPLVVDGEVREVVHDLTVFFRLK